MIRHFPFRSSKGIVVGLLSAAIVPFCALSAHAQTRTGTYDCTEIAVDYQNDPALTNEEKLARMDEAFFASLNQYDACLSQQQSSSQSSSTSSSQASAENGSEDGSENMSSSQQGDVGQSGQGTMAMQQSVASSTMSGTEPPKPDLQAEDLPSGDLTDPGGQSASSMESSNGQGGSETGGQDNTIPEDIPPADNDDALAGQIRYAATQEKDPVKKAQLWNEYRKYKGIPVQ